MSYPVLRQYIRHVINESENPEIVRGPNGIQRIRKTYTVYTQREFDYIVNYLNEVDDEVIEVGPFKFKIEGKGAVPTEIAYNEIVDFINSLGGGVKIELLQSSEGAFNFKFQGEGVVQDKRDYDDVVEFVEAMNGTIERLKPFKFRTTHPTYNVQGQLINLQTGTDR